MNIESAYELIRGKLEGWLTVAVEMLPNFLVAITIVLLFALFARIVRNLLHRSLRRVRLNDTLFRLTLSGIHFIIILAGVFVALSILKLDKTVTSLLAGAGIIGLALSFAFQDIASNLMAGVIISLKKPVHVGEVIEVQGYEGTITRIGLRTTRMKTFRGEEVIVPNKELVQNFVINYSSEGIRRVDVKVGVSYGSDLEKAARLAEEAISGLGMVLKEEEINVLWLEFGDSSINCSVNFWVKYSRNFDYTLALSEGIKAIYRAFKENNIEIPFPIRTVHLSEHTLDRLKDNGG